MNRKWIFMCALGLLAGLIELQKTPIQCRAPQCPSEIYADYLLALAYELTGETQTAAEIYLRIWQTAPQSPYAFLAMSKLEVVR